jgi:hypothetical protein
MPRHLVERIRIHSLADHVAALAQRAERDRWFLDQGIDPHAREWERHHQIVSASRAVYGIGLAWTLVLPVDGVVADGGTSTAPRSVPDGAP